MMISAPVWLINANNAQFFSVLGLCLSVLLLGVLLDMSVRSNKASQEVAKGQVKDRSYGMSLPTIPEDNSICFEIKVE